MFVGPEEIEFGGYLDSYLSLCLDPTLYGFSLLCLGFPIGELFGPEESPELVPPLGPGGDSFSASTGAKRCQSRHLIVLDQNTSISLSFRLTFS